MIQFVVIQEEKGGAVRTLYADYSARILGLRFASNNRGFAECSGFIPMGLQEAFALYAAIGSLRAQIHDTSSGDIYDGRIEDIAITGAGVTLTALGYSRSLSDAPYTALWSTTSVADFRPILDTEVAGATPGRYAFDTNNRVYIAPQKGATLGNTGSIKPGMQGYLTPDQGSRDIIGASFDFVFVVPAVNWRAFFQTRNADFSGIANPWGVTSAAGMTITGTIHTTFAAAPIVNFFVDFNQADAVYAGETGATYLRITNLRLVTTTANRINTTFTANRAAGIAVTATVGSTARMYVGQSLQINAPVSLASESVTVLSIPSSTTFTATFVNAYVIGNPVQAFVVYADEIVDDLVSTTAALNPGHLSDETALIGSPGLDLLDERYEDRLPSDILDYLATMGDAAGNSWEWGVYQARRLYFRVQNSTKTERLWYVDVSDLDIQRTLDQLANSVYAVYQDASGRALRTVATADATSVARYGLTRRAALLVSSTSSTQAGLQQAAALADSKDPSPRAGIIVTQVFDGNGLRWPLWYVAAQDTVIIRNLSPAFGSVIDRIRVFRLTRAEYQFDTDTLLLEPETPRASLEAILAQVAAGVVRKAPTPSLRNWVLS